MNANASESRSLTDATPYVVIDSKTGAEVYRTTYARRSVARKLADRRDTAYGAVRFICRPVFA